MGLYKLTREQTSGKAITGQLYRCNLDGVADDNPFAATLENTDYVIPAGRYRVIVTLSPKFGTPMPLLLGVKGRSGIRIHYGTKPSHSLGCVLITNKSKYIQLLQRLNNEQNDLEDTILDIEDYKS